MFRFLQTQTTMKTIAVLLGVVLLSLAGNCDNGRDLDGEVCASLNNVYKTFANIWELYNEFTSTGKQWIPVDKSLCPASNRDNGRDLDGRVCASFNNVYKTFANIWELYDEYKYTGKQWMPVNTSLCLAGNSDNWTDLDGQVCASLNNVCKAFVNIWEVFDEYQYTGEQWIPVNKTLCLAGNSDNWRDLDGQICASLNNVCKTFANFWELFNEYSYTGKQWIPVDKSLCLAGNSDNWTDLDGRICTSLNNVYKTFANFWEVYNEFRSTGKKWIPVDKSLCQAADSKCTESITIQPPLSKYFEAAKEQQVPANHDSHASLPSSSHHSSSQDFQPSLMFPVYSPEPSSGSYSSLSSSKHCGIIPSPHSVPTYPSPSQQLPLPLSYDSHPPPLISSNCSPIAVPQSVMTYPGPSQQPPTHYPKSKEDYAEPPPQLCNSTSYDSHSLPPSSMHYKPNSQQPELAYPISSPPYGSHSSSPTLRYNIPTAMPRPAPSYQPHKLQSAPLPSYVSHSLSPNSSCYSPPQIPQSQPAYSDSSLLTGPLASSPSPASSSSYYSSSRDLESPSIYPIYSPQSYSPSQASSPTPTSLPISYGDESASQHILEAEPSPSCDSSLLESDSGVYSTKPGSQDLSNYPSVSPVSSGYDKNPAVPSDCSIPCDSSSGEESQLSDALLSISYSGPIFPKDSSEAFLSPSVLESDFDYYSSKQESQNIPIQLPPSSVSSYCDENPAPAPPLPCDSSAPLPTSNCHQSIQEPQKHPPSCKESQSQEALLSEPDIDYYSSKQNSQDIPIQLSTSSISSYCDENPPPAPPLPCDSPSPLPTSNYYESSQEPQKQPAPAYIFYYNETSSQNISESKFSPAYDSASLEPDSGHYNFKQHTLDIPTHPPSSEVSSVYAENPAPPSDDSLPCDSSTSLPSCSYHNPVQESPSSYYGADSPPTYSPESLISSYNKEDFIMQYPEVGDSPPSAYSSPSANSNCLEPSKQAQEEDLTHKYEYISSNPSSEYEPGHKMESSATYSKPSVTLPEPSPPCSLDGSSENSKHFISHDNQPSQPNGHYNNDEQYIPEKQPHNNAETYTSPEVQTKPSGDVALPTLKTTENFGYSNSNMDSQAMGGSRQNVGQNVYNGNVYLGPYYYQPKYEYIFLRTFPFFSEQNTPSAAKVSAAGNML